MTRALATPRRARAIAAVLIALATAIATAALAAGCDRIVNLTPFYDGQPARDAFDAPGFELDGAPAADGHPAFDGATAPSDGGLDGGVATGDGGPFPDDGNLDGNLAVDGG